MRKYNMINMDGDLAKPEKLRVEQKNKSQYIHKSFSLLIGYATIGFVLCLLLFFVQLYLPIGFELLIIMLLYISSKTQGFLTGRQYLNRTI